MAFLEVKNLGKSFANRKLAEKVVFKDLNFQIKSGEFVSILGPSGCGKSTLLRIFGGLEEPSNGVVTSQARQKSFIFQEPRLLPWRNCFENTILPLELQSREVDPGDRQKAKELLRMLRMEESSLLFPHQLSGGMKMRASIARGLITSPDLLLFDEPFAALDETTRHYLQEELRALYEKNGWTVIFVTHSVEEACFLSNRLLIFSSLSGPLREYHPGLPAQRLSSLRDEWEFFEEVKRLRKFVEEGEVP